MVIQFPPDLQMKRQMERIRSSVDQYRNAPYRSADWLAGELMTIFDTEPANDVLAALDSRAGDAIMAGEADTYTRWLAGDETLPTLSREQYLRFQACSDRAIKDRQRRPKTVADRVEEVRRNPDDPDWDNCPACKVGALDTGYECNACGFDAQPLVHLKDSCEARGERMHPSGLYESEIAHPFPATPAPAVDAVPAGEVIKRLDAWLAAEQIDESTSPQNGEDFPSWSSGYLTAIDLTRQRLAALSHGEGH